MKLSVTRRPKRAAAGPPTSCGTTPHVDRGAPDRVHRRLVALRHLPAAAAGAACHPGGPAGVHPGPVLHLVPRTDVQRRTQTPTTPRRPPRRRRPHRRRRRRPPRQGETSADLATSPTIATSPTSPTTTTPAPPGVPPLPGAPSPHPLRHQRRARSDVDPRRADAVATSSDSYTGVP